VVQRKLFYADKDNYKMDFKPGWYDNAETGKLRIEVFFFAKMDTVKAEPKPTATEGQTMAWEKTNLRKGEKFSITVSFPKKVFPKEIDSSELQFVMPCWGWALIIIAVILVILLIAWLASQSDGDGYGGGGGIFGGGGGGGGGGGIFSGGGGGFGGRSSSCACACVSCACACACAGGGGAGCSRKTTRRCPLCRDCGRKDSCPLWKGGAS